MALTETYVDPAIAAGSGTGTIGDPYGDLQYALDTMTRDSTNGDRINIKTGTDESATSQIVLTTYGSPTEQAPLVLQGYSSSAGDGGVFGVDGNNGAYTAINFSGKDYCHFLDGHVHNGQQHGIASGNYGSFLNLEINDIGNGTYDGITTGGLVTISGCHVHDVAGEGLRFTSGVAIGNYLKNDGTRDFTAAIRCNGSGAVALNNIISIDGASDGIQLAQGASALGNSILSSAGTGQGLVPTASAQSIMAVINNYLEGFSGTGGVGVDMSTTGTVVQMMGQNAFYNNATHINDPNAHLILDLGDDETLSVTGLAKSGSDTFANRFTYFAPVDTGNMQTGGYPEA